MYAIKSIRRWTEVFCLLVPEFFGAERSTDSRCEQHSYEFDTCVAIMF